MASTEDSGQPENPPVVVIFRKWRDRRLIGDGIIALFPQESGSRGTCLSYEHVGQHGDANYMHVITHSRPASPDQYAALKRELESPPFEYKLIVRTRAPH